MRIITITQHSDNQVAISFPFDNEAKNALKAAVDYYHRDFDWTNKAWLVDNEYAQDAIDAIKPYFDSVADARTGDDVEEAQIEAEIAQIEANQKVIQDEEAWIKQRIEDLEAMVSRYSYRSRSSVKAGLARDAALLRHSLDNARLPVERMTELQVRGLAAAVHYVNDPPRI